jgi:ATP-dependent RNA helicase DOB1
VQLIVERKFEPVIVFSFSKKEVEGFAHSLNKFDFNTDQEKENIETIFTAAIEGLSEEDKKLSMVPFQRLS